MTKKVVADEAPPSHYVKRVRLNVGSIATQAAEEALGAVLREAITLRMTEELRRILAQPRLQDLLGGTVRDAVRDVVRKIDWQNGTTEKVGFSEK